MSTPPGTAPGIDPDVFRIADRLRPSAPPERPLKVFMWPADDHSGCFTYRVKMVADELTRLRHEVQVGQRMGAWAREEADIIVGQRVVTGGPSAMWQMLCKERTANGRGGMVFEVDDDLFNIDRRTNPAAAVFHQPAARTNMIDNMRAANLITVTTDPLAALLRRWNPSVAVLPNAVRAETLAIPAPARRGTPDGLTVFGWQGSPTHVADWEACRAPVCDVLQGDPNTRIQFLGFAYPRGLPPAQISGKPWQPDIDKHYRNVVRFDVSLAPLQKSIFNMSKSGLRVQESLALGVPVVASDVLAYRPVVEPGVTGFLARSPQQWRAALEELKDPGLRQAMGKAGRQAARAWQIEERIHGWVSAYRALL